jgi:hypothetical protein
VKRRAVSARRIDERDGGATGREVRMSSGNGTTVEELRMKSQAILDRAKGDDQFLQRLKDDPAAALKEGGIPDDYIAEGVPQLSDAPEVEAHARCDRYSCWISWCPYIPDTG